MKQYSKVCTVGLICLFVLNGCSENNTKEGVAATEVTGASGSSSIFGKNTEEKVDDFLADYVKDLKEAMNEQDDQKAIVLLKEMKAEYEPRAADLKAEVEEWEKSLSDADKQSLEKRMEGKPYIKDLISVGFTAGSRFNKTPELQKAFDDLNSSMDFGDFDDTEEEEYPEEESEEGQEDNN